MVSRNQDYDREFGKAFSIPVYRQQDAWRGRRSTKIDREETEKQDQLMKNGNEDSQISLNDDGMRMQDIELCSTDEKKEEEINQISVNYGITREDAELCSNSEKKEEIGEINQISKNNGITKEDTEFCSTNEMKEEIVEMCDDITSESIEDSEFQNNAETENNSSSNNQNITCNNNNNENSNEKSVIRESLDINDDKSNTKKEESIINCQSEVKNTDFNFCHKFTATDFQQPNNEKQQMYKTKAYSNKVDSLNFNFTNHEKETMTERNEKLVEEIKSEVEIVKQLSQNIKLGSRRNEIFIHKNAMEISYVDEYKKKMNLEDIDDTSIRSCEKCAVKSSVETLSSSMPIGDDASKINGADNSLQFCPSEDGVRRRQNVKPEINNFYADQSDRKSSRVQYYLLRTAIIVDIVIVVYLIGLYLNLYP